MKIFLSHSRRDKPLIREIQKHLPRPIQSWLDEENLLVGDELGKSLQEAINLESDYFIVFIGESALDSEWVQKELSWALTRERELGRRFVLPVVLDERSWSRLELREIKGRNFLACTDLSESGVKAFSATLSEHLIAWLNRRLDDRTDHGRVATVASAHVASAPPSEEAPRSHSEVDSTTAAALSSNATRVVDRCVNMMLGIAIGDAFGAGYESLSPDEVKHRFTFTRYDKAPHPRAADHMRGHYTDDTQMSLAVTEALCSGQRFDTDTLAKFLHDAYHRDKRPGYSGRTRQALEQATVEGFLKASVTSFTNGAAMRAVPLGVVSQIESVKEFGVVNGQTTHRTPEAVVSSVAVALASHYFFYNVGPVRDVFAFCLEHMSRFRQVPTAYFSDLARLRQLDATRLEGWDRQRGLGLSGTAMAGAAILLAAISTTPAELLRDAVHLGGDTDTLASVALGLFAARSSLESLPAFLHTQLENGRYGRDYIVATGKRLATVCPMDVQMHARANYSGQRKRMITHPLDGILEPIEPVFIHEIMRRLMREIHYDSNDVIVGIDASGYIPALVASMMTGLPVSMATKADLADHTDRIEFQEPHAAVKSIFLYYPRPGRRVIIVDDEITTGQTVCSLLETLTRRGWEVLGVVVPVESTVHGARELLAQRGVRLISHTKHALA